MHKPTAQAMRAAEAVLSVPQRMFKRETPSATRVLEAARIIDSECRLPALIEALEAISEHASYLLETDRYAITTQQYNAVCAAVVKAETP